MGIRAFSTIHRSSPESQAWGWSDRQPTAAILMLARPSPRPARTAPARTGPSARPPSSPASVRRPVIRYSARASRPASADWCFTHTLSRDGSFPSPGPRLPRSGAFHPLAASVPRLRDVHLAAHDAPERSDTPHIHPSVDPGQLHRSRRSRPPCRLPSQPYLHPGALPADLIA